MSNSQSNDELMQQLVFSILEMQGLLSANNTILHSLLTIVCENAPELIESVKSKIDDVSELKLSMNEITSDIYKNSFEREIQQALLQFDLMKESSKYSHTFIAVNNKQ